MPFAAGAVEEPDPVGFLYGSVVSYGGEPPVVNLPTTDDVRILLDDPGPPRGYTTGENTLGWTTKADGQLDKWVWDVDGPGITTDVDMGRLTAKKDISSEKDYLMMLNFSIVGWFWYDGDGVFDPVPNKNNRGVGDDPCPNEPFKLFTVHVNDRKVRTIEGENTRDCTPGSAEVSRVFDVKRVGNDEPNWVRVPKDFIKNGKNKVRIEIHDHELPAYMPYHSKYSDGFQMWVQNIRIELAAPPLIINHGWTKELNPDLETVPWQPTLRNNMFGEAKVHFGQNPWAWADKHKSKGILNNAWNRRNDLRDTAAVLAGVGRNFHSELGFKGEGWLHGHSMGGILSRLCVEYRQDCFKVYKLAQTGTPNLGSELADKLTWWRWQEYEAKDEDYVATYWSFLGAKKWTGWRDWWDRSIHSYWWKDGPGHGREQMTDFQLKPIENNPVLTALNKLFPKGGVEYYTTRGKFSGLEGKGTWVLLGANDGAVSLDSATINGRIISRTIDIFHEDIPAQRVTARWMVRFYSDLAMNTGLPTGWGVDSPSPFLPSSVTTEGPVVADPSDEPYAETGGAYLAITAQDLVGGPYAHPVEIDSGLPSAEFVVMVRPGESPINVTLAAPSGKLYTADIGEIGEDGVTYRDGETTYSHTYRFTAMTPEAGRWQIRIDPADVPPTDGLPVFVGGYAESDARMTVKAGRSRYLPGETSLILATLKQSGRPLTGAAVTASKIDEGGKETKLTLLDDGAHGDGAPNDGVYGEFFAVGDEERSHTFDVRAEGSASHDATIVRTGRVEVIVAAYSDVSISNGDISGSPEGAWGGEKVTLKATVHSNGERAVRGTTTIGFYDGEPATGVKLADASFTDELEPGESKTVSVEIEAPTHVLDLHVVVASTDLELNPGDNSGHKVMPFVPTPKTAATLTGPLGKDGWYTGPVTVKLAPFDGSPPPYRSTHYQIGGGPVQTYGAPFTISAEGNFALSFWSVDAAGRTEKVRETSVKIDASAPTGRLLNPSAKNTHVADRTAATPSGYTLVVGLVDVKIAAADAVSGVASVKLFVDNDPAGEAKLAEDGFYHSLWDTTKASTGNHELRFVVEDFVGFTATGKQRVYVTASRTLEINKDPNATVTRLRPIPE